MSIRALAGRSLPALLLVLAVTAPCAAVETSGAQLRLVDAGFRDGRPDVGLEIALAPGWKTYWRYPGDAGIPPRFDAAGSVGLAEVTARFPVPERFDESGLTAIGYTRPVILPLDLVLADPGRPADLRLKVQIGLCRDICVPLDADLSLHLDPAAVPDAAAVRRLAAARATLPVPASATRLPRIVGITRDDDTAPPTVSVEVLEPPSLADEAVDLLVEGPTADWALPQPKPVMPLASPARPDDPKGRTRVWRFELDGAPPKADRRAVSLRFTLRVGSAAVEQTVGLDGTGVLP